MGGKEQENHLQVEEVIFQLLLEGLLKVKRKMAVDANS